MKKTSSVIVADHQTLLNGTIGTVTISGGGPGWHEIYEVYYPSISQWVLADAQTCVHFNTNHTLVFGVGRDDNDCPTASISYSSAGGTPTISSNVSTTVGSITSGTTAYTYDKLQTIISSVKTTGFLLAPKEVNIIVGLEDRVAITSGLFTFTAPPQSATYKSVFNDQPPLSWMSTWNWKLAFYSNTNSWIASLSSNNSSSWNVPGFTLPTTGYKWLYDEKGYVMGSVSVEGYDSDGKYQFDSKPIRYYVSNPYPMDVYYQNKSISTGQSEVKAHNLISLSNDQFLSGANVSFKSGYSIEINDNVSFQNGSTINITVDPSVR